MKPRNTRNTRTVKRSLAIMEAMTGTMYVAVLISRLVALYSSANQTAKPEI